MPKLKIHLVEARNLLAADRGGTSDPYVKLSHCKFSAKSRMIKKTLNPKWDETYWIDINNTKDIDVALKLELWDHDTVGKDDPLGNVEVHLSQLIKNKEEDKWHPVVLKGKQHGDLHLVLTAVDFGREPPAPAAPPANAPYAYGQPTPGQYPPPHGYPQYDPYGYPQPTGAPGQYPPPHGYPQYPQYPPPAGQQTPYGQTDSRAAMHTPPTPPGQMHTPPPGQYGQPAPYPSYGQSAYGQPPSADSRSAPEQHYTTPGQQYSQQYPPPHGHYDPNAPYAQSTPDMRSAGSHPQPSTRSNSAPFELTDEQKKYQDKLKKTEKKEKKEKKKEKRMNNFKNVLSIAGSVAEIGGSVAGAFLGDD